MSGANPHYDRTYELLDPDNPPELASENPTHWVYFCPWCEEKHGKSDSKGKLYFSKTKLVGICFRCNTVALSQQHGGAEPDELQTEIGRFTDSFLSHKDDHTSIAFRFDPLTLRELAYLHHRNPFLLGLVGKLGMQRWNGTRAGVVIPFWYRNRISRFQVRFLGEGGLKYYTSPGSRLLYSPDGLLNSFKLKREDTVTLCEGVFDSIALRLLGYPNPIAVLGSTVTQDQLVMLRRLMPSNLMIAMDSWDIGLALQGTTRRLPSVSETLIVTETLEAKDPEAYLVANQDRLAQRIQTNYLEWLHETG